jgi:putative transposase
MNCLNETLFSSLASARVGLGCWRANYHGSRPHFQLGGKHPSEFAFTLDPRWDLALRYAKAPRQLPSLPCPTSFELDKSRGKVT